MVQFPKSKTWRIGIIVVPTVFIVGLYFWTKPRKVIDARLFGKWVSSDSKSIEFRTDETFVLRTSNNEWGALSWWSEEGHVLYVLHPDEDAPGWVRVPYHFDGKDHLLLDNAQFWDLPSDSKRVTR